MANAGVVHRTADSAPGAWERFVDLYLDGLRSAAATPTAAAPAAIAVERAMEQHGRALGYA
jgi:hypothetical protein